MKKSLIYLRALCSLVLLYVVFASSFLNANTSPSFCNFQCKHTVENEVEAEADQLDLCCFGQTQDTATNLPDGFSTISSVFLSEVTVNVTSGSTADIVFMNRGCLDVEMTVINGQCLGIFRDHVSIASCDDI